mmetsp:Transcript_10248/g.33893  ORF Transcript_10248/g.33893 Transcript_10248/m.33893 type:complete len:344 (+) Transcript_10248:448-1479(+)
MVSYFTAQSKVTVPTTNAAPIGASSGIALFCDSPGRNPSAARSTSCLPIKPSGKGYPLVSKVFVPAKIRETKGSRTSRPKTHEGSPKSKSLINSSSGLIFFRFFPVVSVASLLCVVVAVPSTPASVTVPSAPGIVAVPFPSSQATTSSKGLLWNFTASPSPKSREISLFISFPNPFASNRTSGCFFMKVPKTSPQPTVPSISATSACSHPYFFGRPGLGIGTSIACIFFIRHVIGGFNLTVVISRPPITEAPAIVCPISCKSKSTSQYCVSVEHRKHAWSMTVVSESTSEANPFAMTLIFSYHASIKCKRDACQRRVLSSFVFSSFVFVSIARNTRHNASTAS